jgi:hypothetical protein
VRLARADGVREASRHEIAGCEAAAVRLALWGFEACCSADGRAGGVQQGAEAARASGRMWWEALRAGHCRRLSEPGGSHEARGVVAGSEPAGRTGSGARETCTPRDMTTTSELALLTYLSKQAIAGASHGVDLL